MILGPSDRILHLTLVSVAIAALATSPLLAVRSFTLPLSVAVLFLTARMLRDEQRERLLEGCPAEGVLTR